MTCHDTYLSCAITCRETSVATASIVRAFRVLPAALLAAPLTLLAQLPTDAPQERRAPRRVILAIVGALAGGAGGAFFHRQGGSNCGACYVGSGAVIGGIAGYFIGRDFDRAYARRYRGAARLRIPFLEQRLDGDPVTLAARDTLLAVATSSGVMVFSSTRSLTPLSRRATSIRNIAALELAPRSHALLVAAPTGLYRYPAARGAGVLLREGTIQAATATDSRLFLASGARIEVAPLAADSAQAWPGIELHASVTDMEWDSVRQILWALTDTLLVSLRPDADGLRVSSITRVDAGGRALASNGDRIAIAHGSDGLAILEANDIAAPREIARWRGARFVYDVTFDGSRVYAGAGPEGVFVIDTSALPPRTVGLAFDLGFVATLLSRDGYIYILDRRTASVRRISTPTTR
jgi:hypothetical protein